LGVDAVDPAPDPLWARGVIEQNYRGLLAYAYAATGDEHLGRDIVQETFRIAYQKRHEYEPSSPLGAWLRGIARNLLKQRPRSTRVLSLEALDGLEVAAAGLQALHADDTYEESRLRALRDCLAALQGKTRELLELRYGGSLSLKQLSARSGIGLSGVGMALARARGALSACVQKRMTL